MLIKVWLRLKIYAIIAFEMITESIETHRKGMALKAISLYNWRKSIESIQLANRSLLTSGTHYCHLNANN